MGADPVYKVDRCGASRQGSMREKDENMVTTALGIDVSKDRLDAEIAACGKPRSKYFANSPDGWRQLLAWLKELKIKRVHACLEATGRYSLGIALMWWTAPASGLESVIR